MSEPGDRAAGGWYLLQAATARHGHRALWLAARYDYRFVRIDGQWLFERVELRTRFVTSHERGWAEEPMAKIAPRAS